MKEKLRKLAAAPFLVAGIGSIGVAIVILIGVDEARERFRSARSER